jgi:WD40 repeat protein
VSNALELADGRLLSWSWDDTLRLWSAQGEPLTALSGHTGTVYGALELADGRLLSWSDDNTLRLWSAAGEAVAVLSGHTSDVDGALELSDGRLLSWSDDGTLRLWDIPRGDLVAYGCARVFRDFTPEERLRYGIPAGPTCPPA